MPNMNYQPTRISHRALAIRANGLNAALDDAIDALQTATSRERVLNDGEAERRADLEATYPALRES
jgi:hypothetical protein